MYSLALAYVAVSSTATVLLILAGHRLSACRELEKAERQAARDAENARVDRLLALCGIYGFRPDPVAEAEALLRRVTP